MSQETPLIIGGIEITDFEKTLDALASAEAIKGEYKSWKKNAPFLYDLVMTSVLDQVSLSVEWFPEVTEDEEQGYTTRRLLLGTQSSNNDPNHVLVAEVRIPKTGKDSKEGAYIQHSGKIEIVQEIPHDGDVHRARMMPQNSNIIATKTSTKDVFIFDRTHYPAKSQHGTEMLPLLRLTGHTDDGYAISWNPNKQAQLVSGASDGSICLWNLDEHITHYSDPVLRQNASSATSGSSTVPRIAPTLTFSAHTDVVEDVSFHPKNEYMFGSCGDDRMICIWDSRDHNKPKYSILDGHTAEINSFSWNHHDENIFATGSSDKTIGMWDLRNLSQKLHSFEAHTSEVYNVQWSPFASHLLASSSNDRRVIVWDIRRIGDEQSQEDNEDGPPELMMLHAGHTDRLNDFAWCPHRDWLIASVADNDVLQIWEFAQSVREEIENENEGNDDHDDEDVDDEDLE